MSDAKLYNRIESSGTQGVRKTALRRQFGVKAGKAIEELLTKGLVFTEKKRGIAIYWTKDNYMQHLMSSDPKFKLIYNIYSDTHSKINNDLNKKVSQIRTDLNNKVTGMVAEANASSIITEKDNNGNGNQNGDHLTLDQFKMEFDRTIAETPTAIGWIELGMIRERICAKYDISKHDFYSLASQLFDQFSNLYELSSGGNEGVTVRGLVHGFVRCI